MGYPYRGKLPNMDSARIRHSRYFRNHKPYKKNV